MVSEERQLTHKLILIHTCVLVTSNLGQSWSWLNNMIASSYVDLIVQSSIA